MPQYQQPPYKQRFSKLYLKTAPNVADDLVMDMQLPQGAVSFSNQFNDSGAGTTNATIGTTQQITHRLGVVPNFITLTPKGNAVVYLDAANPPTATTFNVLGSVASLNFNWKVE